MPPPNASLARVLLPEMLRRQQMDLQAAAAQAAHDWNYRICWPLDSNQLRPGLTRRSNDFGAGVRVGRDGRPRDHQGWDLSARIGLACWAIANGRVEFVHAQPVGAYGRQVCLEFAAAIPGLAQQRFYAFYAHLSAVMVAAGQPVDPMTVVGLTGDSGNAEGEAPHLHFEIRTVAAAGLGLPGRIHPRLLYGHTPIDAPVLRTREGVRR